MNEWLDDFRTATAFLTRLPMPHPQGATPENFVRAHRMFPLVGALIGTAVGLLCLALRAIGVPDLAAAALALGGSAVLTGALHEDGLADVADGFGGGRDVAAKLEIMRDSRLGTYGAVILLVSFVAKCLALAVIPDRTWYLACWSRMRWRAASCRGCRSACPMRATMDWRATPVARTGDSDDLGWPCAFDRIVVVVVRHRAVRCACSDRERGRHGADGKTADRRPDRRRARRGGAGGGDRDSGAARRAAGMSCNA